jgi:peptidoglycan/LPS O-acetylase OafA/YrhL
VRSATELPRPRYRPSLDGIRGVAILAVLIYHCGLLSGGFLGVDVFFTLSGFLITSLLLAEYAATGRISLRHFYARRALRLLPALGGLLVSGGLVLVAAYPEFWRLICLYVAAVLFYVANWAKIAGWGLGIFGHTWSLAIEEQFYLIWPLAVWGLVSTVRRPRVVGLLLIAAAAGSLLWRITLAASGPRIYLGLDTHADGLLLGAAVAFWAMRGDLVTARRAWIWHTAGALAALALLGLFLTSRYDPSYRQGVTVLAAGVTAVLMLDAPSPGSWLAPVLEARWLVGLGRISYGVYLWHFPVFFWTGCLRQEGTGPAAPPLTLLFGWGLTVAIALTSYVVIERPALAYKTRFQINHPSRPPTPPGDRLIADAPSRTP